LFSLPKGIKNYYIVAPANSATGGPELLHQLAYKLKRYGKTVYMFYIPDNYPSPIHHNYKQYYLDFVREIEDNEQNVIIIPETKTELLLKYKKAKKIIWWLSVDNYFFCLPGLKGLINRLILKKFNSQKYLFFNKNLLKIADFHLVQSEYAYAWLNKNGINNFGFLSDYLHESFINVKTELDFKQNIVVYNPKKGVDVTKKLIKNSPNIKFVAIENMTREEVVKLLQKSKVYIDFGYHPGKDRIPREAAILGCCIITNKRGSAKFSKDMPINEEFKFNENNFSAISEKIEECFNNYILNLDKFERYRQEIRLQEFEFVKQLEVLFKEEFI
jgi:hypothetical protein